ncbi:MAG TPA: hypothetical protein VHC42_05195 [Rhizomicrobium sp.]|nr:hypothetical protein [Rhizomicrobium sp.]
MDARSPDAFVHVRMILGFVVSLGLARLLAGLARFVQHPALKRDPLHLTWALATLLLLVNFWWWEFWLFSLKSWTFSIYAFLLFFAFQLYLLTALLFPENIAEYENYGDYFMRRRQWFFGVFAAVNVFDVIDTLIKGPAHVSQYEADYWIQPPAYLALCLAAIVTTNRKFHYAFAAGNIAYQLYFIGRSLASIG